MSVRPGVWHQFGNRSQKLSREQLEAGIGVGTIVSPRDLSPEGAAKYAEQYRDLGAHVVLDPQFHSVEHSVGQLDKWSFDAVRQSVTAGQDLRADQVDRLATQLADVNARLGSAAVIAPSLVYQPGHPEVAALNEQLFRAARIAGDSLDKPVLGTIVVGQAALATDAAFTRLLSSATARAADGWYYAAEFGPDRIPSDPDRLLRALKGCLKLTAAGKPVLFGFAGPTALLAVAAGAAGVGIGHAQNLWRFEDRLAPREGSGGGGNAPSRLFSRKLWSTIVYPDEVVLLPEHISTELVEESPFAAPLGVRPPVPPLSRWDAGKHLVWVIGDELQRQFEVRGARARAASIAATLGEALRLAQEIANAGVPIKDNTLAHQLPWKRVLDRLLEEGEPEFDVLELSGQ